MKIRVYLKKITKFRERSNELYPNLFAEMARKKITQASLANRVHRTPTTLSLKLNGKAPITLAECVEIKKAIGTELSIDQLFASDSDAEER